MNRPFSSFGTVLFHELFQKNPRILDLWNRTQRTVPENRSRKTPAHIELSSFWNGTISYKVITTSKEGCRGGIGAWSVGTYRRSCGRTVPAFQWVKSMKTLGNHWNGAPFQSENRSNDLKKRSNGLERRGAAHGK